MSLPTRPFQLATVVASALAAAAIASCGRSDTTDDGRAILRVGHFPNVTHAQGLLGHRSSREGKGWFEERLPRGTEVEWFVLNAGPAAMEALLAGTIDLAYVGPSPAINAHVRSRGAEIRVIAGAARGGSALVIRANAGIEKPADLRGKKIATPQLGNTQDVACRAWLGTQGIRVTQTGGDAMVVPTANPQMFPLFLRRELDAAWTVEPWVARLEREAGATILVEEKDSVTTVLVASAGFLEKRRELARAFAKAHSELTAWIAANPDAAQLAVRQEIAAETHQSMPADLLQHCWPRLRFTTAVSGADFASFVEAARSVGFLSDGGDVSRLVEEP